MSIKTLLLQLVASTTQLPGYRRFRSALGRVEQVQRRRLARYLEQAARTEFGRETGLQAGWSYEEFARQVPVRGYAELEPWIERQRSARASSMLTPGGAPRFEPTSGSTSRRKWIPYSPALMSEFDAAASPWLFDLVRTYPGILRGPHYWSLSWIPTELRAELATADDLEVFPAWKRLVMNRIMAVPSEVSRLPTLEASLLSTLARLVAAQDLSLISVWSPTFLLQLLGSLSERREEVMGMLGASSARARWLGSWDGVVGPDFTRQLWPRLALISAWDSSTSSAWADELRKLFPGVPLQGKGLWATEGVVTIPFEGHHPLAVTSHFLEFRDLDSGSILPSWELREGQLVQPILSTASGFFRYALQDRARVSGFLGGCACLRFEGRLGGGTDLVGEKMDPTIAGAALARLGAMGLGHCISLLARLASGEKPRYLVLVVRDEVGSRSWERAIAGAQDDPLAAPAEQELLTTHHYRLARELGQLAPAGAIVFASLAEAQQFYEKNCLQGARLAGGMKTEALALWKSG